MKNKLNFIVLILFCLTMGVVQAQTSTETPILPAHLQPGDTVGLVSSGFRVPDDQTIQFAAERLQALGLKVKYGKFLFQHNICFTGSDKERAQDLNDMFADSKVKAIFEVRGGWGSNRILPYLDFTLIKKNPKIIIGFSDITSLLLAINSKTGLITFHGTMGMEPWPSFTVDYLKRVLFTGEKVVFSNPVNVDLKSDIIQTENRIHTITRGTAQGKLLGGNLAVLTSMLGSEYLPQWKGAILFVEDVDEDYYKIDRMMAQLQMAGVLKLISGFVFGQCMNCSSTTNMIGSMTLNEILDQYIKPLGIPAWSGAMIGHMPEMFTLPEGAKVQINADQGTITLLEPVVK
jgi:muramoyltetrapeptide carboxypeptidase